MLEGSIVPSSARNRWLRSAALALFAAAVVACGSRRAETPRIPAIETEAAAAKPAPAPQAAAEPALSDPTTYVPGRPKLDLKLPDAFQPAGRTRDGALFRFAGVPDVQVHVAVTREDADAIPDAKALLESMVTQVRAAGVDDMTSRVTKKGEALVAWSAVVHVDGRDTFTRHWVLARSDGKGGVLRADVVLGLPALWRKQKATSGVIAAIDQRFDEAELRAGS